MSTKLSHDMGIFVGLGLIALILLICHWQGVDVDLWYWAQAHASSYLPLK